MQASYDWISIPLVYTQVVTLSTYAYFFTCLLARQYLDPTSKHATSDSGGFTVDLYFPVFTIVQFVLYIGWLKVAETLLNPLGEDDDDFEVNYIIDRSLALSFYQVTENYNKIPSLEQDPHLGETQPDIPHTTASAGVKTTGFAGSVAQLNVERSDKQNKTESNENGLLRNVSVPGSQHGSYGSPSRQTSCDQSKTIRPQLMTEQSVSVEESDKGRKSPGLSRPGSRLSVKNLIRSLSRQTSTASTTSTVLATASSTSSVAEDLKPLTTTKPASKNPAKKQLQLQQSISDSIELGFLDADSSTALISPSPTKQTTLLDTIAENQETDESHSQESTRLETQKL